MTQLSTLVFPSAPFVLFMLCWRCVGTCLQSTRQGGGGMDFVAIVDQVITLLRQRGRMTYRTLQRQFQLDDDALHDLTDELLYAHPEVRDDAGRGLVWTGEVGPTRPSS